MFKSDYALEGYVTNYMSRSVRPFLAQLRLGILPLHVETGRFITLLTPLENRLCPLCENNLIEDEIYFIIVCKVYNEDRIILFNELLLSVSLLSLSKEFLFQTVINSKNQRSLARYIQRSYHIRNKILYNK